MNKNIHIGYGDSAADCILDAISNHGLPGRSVVPSRDDFTQGPISDCMTLKGINQRIRYWEAVEEVLRFGIDVNAFYHKSLQLLEIIDSDQVTIWVGASCHDILGTGWVLSFLKEKNLKWFIVDLANIGKEEMIEELPVINLAQYTPAQVSNLWKYRKALVEKEKEFYISTFQKACEENSQYRIKIGDKIKSVGQDYYDQYILSHLTHGFESSRKIIGRILRDGKHSISDTTIEYNIKKLMDKSLIEYEKDTGMKTDYFIKRRMV